MSSDQIRTVYRKSQPLAPALHEFGELLRLRGLPLQPTPQPSRRRLQVFMQW
jgi:hypothetical protein